MRLLICDLDGTLTQTARIDEACFSMALRQEFGIRDFNRDWSSYSLRTDWGQGREILENWFERAPRPDELNRLHYRFLSLLEQAHHSNPEFFQALPGAIRMIEHLQQKPDWQLAVVSGGWQTISRLKLRWAGFPALPLYCPRDCSPQNPAGDNKEALLRCAISKAGIQDPSKAVYLADNEWDMQYARKVGCRFLIFSAAELGLRMLEEGADGLLCDFRDLESFDRALSTLSEASC